MFLFFFKEIKTAFLCWHFFNDVFFIIVRVTYWRKSLLNLCSSLVLEKLHALVFRKWYYKKITSSLLLLLNPWNNTCPSITCGIAANFTFTSGCSLAISFQTLLSKAKRLLWARAIKEQPEVLLSQSSAENLRSCCRLFSLNSLLVSSPFWDLKRPLFSFLCMQFSWQCTDFVPGQSELVALALQSPPSFFF